MKKINFALAVFFFCFIFQSVAQQEQEWEMKKQLLTRIDSFVSGFIKASELRLPGGDRYSDEVAANYRNYFLSDAKVYNEMAPAMLDGDREHPFFLRFTPVDEYLSKIKTYFPGALRQDLLRYTVDYSRLSSGNLRIIMQKAVFGTSRDGFELRNNDTISVEVKTGPGNSDLKISRILKLGSEFTILNDKDKDFIIDQLDKCPEVAGIASYNGCPPPDRPLAFVGLELNFGLSVSNTLDGPHAQDLGYNEPIASKLIMGEVRVDDNQSSHFGATVQYDRFFGRKRIFGAGAGLSFQHYSTELTLPEFHVEYKAMDNSSKVYRRVVHANSAIVENIKMNYLVIPLTAKYKEKLFAKGGVYVDAGIAISFLLSGSGKANTSFDYGAIYSLDAGTGNWVYDNNTIPKDSDWIITGNFVNQHNGNNSSSTDTYFDAHSGAGLDVGVNRNVNTESDFKLNASVALLLKAGVFYKILENAEASLGIIYFSDSHTNNQASDYKITDKAGEYSSLMNGSNKLTTHSTGISLGVKFSLE